MPGNVAVCATWRHNNKSPRCDPGALSCCLCLLVELVTRLPP